MSTSIHPRVKSERNAKVDVYVSQATKWQEEIAKLRNVILGCGLTEEFKWGKPCYTFEGSNVVIILPLKNYCTLLFAKGALLHDTKGILIQPTENTQAARQIRLTSGRQIVELETTLIAYISQAVEVEKAGLEVNYKKPADFTIPEELRSKLDESPALKAAFHALTPGRQRGYNLYFSAAKQAKTRELRVEKHRQRILDGKGLND
jgi:uncharacterized protein YdeI (YjbR/CyaY-like superfamily)